MRANVRILIQREGSEAAKEHIYNSVPKPPNPYPNDPYSVLYNGKYMQWEKGWTQGLETYGERKRLDDRHKAAAARFALNNGDPLLKPVSRPRPAITTLYRVYRNEDGKHRLLDTFTDPVKAVESGMRVSAQYCNKFNDIEVWECPPGDYSTLPAPGSQMIHRCHRGVSNRVPSLKSFVRSK